LVARALMLLAACAAACSAACVGDPAELELSPAERAALERHLATQPPAQMIRHEASFGGSALDPDVELVGYLLKPRTLTQRAGERFELTLVWRVHRAPPAGYRVFTHLRDEGGAMLVNLDSQGPLRARAGTSGAPLPPSAWPEGKYVLDEVQIELPLHASGRVEIHAGFYRGHERLTAHGDGAAPELGAAVLKLTAKGADSSQVPELDVPHIDGAAVAIDGKLDEAAWARAAQTGAFVVPRHGQVDPAAAIGGSARVFYDDAHLYLAFIVADDDLAGGFPAGARDAHLWTRDTVEVMIDPDGDGDNRDYYEIQISPQNLVFDSRFDDYNQPRGGAAGPFGHEDWTADIDSAVAVSGTLDDARDRDEGYVVEARVAFASFAKARRLPPAPGDVWRANFYAMENNAGLAWSPILGQGNFHRASRFGRLVFGAPTREP
jgi:hypothetical protein